MNLGKRSLVSLTAGPLGIAFIFFGEQYSALMFAVLCAIAAWEFTNLFKAGGYTPSGFFLSFQVVVLMFIRWWGGFEYDQIILPALIMSNMLYAIYLYTNGDRKAAHVFVIMMGGIFYVGYLGSYYLSIRALPQGEWWVLLALFPIWLADSGAYLIGSLFGKHKLVPNLSPKKTWEGYFGGLAFSVVFIPLFVILFEYWGFSGIPLWKSAIYALVMSAFSVFGDFGVSIIKRQFDVKDSGTILPGHGGMLDRMDTWLWNAAFSYFIIIWFLI